MPTFVSFALRQIIHEAVAVALKGKLKPKDQHHHEPTVHVTIKTCKARHLPVFTMRYIAVGLHMYIHNTLLGCIILKLRLTVHCFVMN